MVLKTLQKNPDWLIQIWRDYETSTAQKGSLLRTPSYPRHTSTTMPLLCDKELSSITASLTTLHYCTRLQQQRTGKNYVWKSKRKSKGIPYRGRTNIHLFMFNIPFYGSLATRTKTKTQQSRGFYLNGDHLNFTAGVSVFYANSEIPLTIQWWLCCILFPQNPLSSPPLLLTLLRLHYRNYINYPL